jgi:hypothetical protein
MENIKKKIKRKRSSQAYKLQEGIDYEVDNIDDYIKRVKSAQALKRRVGPQAYKRGASRQA